ncbi:MAG: FHA domain-containing protein, partial [Phycisphaeraceae bacterium JB051]
MLILTVIQGPDKGRRFELPDDEPQIIGRSSESLPLLDQTISRRHAELTPDEGKWYINDQESANGTFVNGHRVTRPRLLQPGDQVRTGLTLFVYGSNTVQAKKTDSIRMFKSNEMDANVES